MMNVERFLSCFLILNNFVFIIESQKSIVSGNHDDVAFLDDSYLLC